MSPPNFEQQTGDGRQQSPVYVDYEKLFSLPASRRKEPAIEENCKYMLRDGYIKMGGGFPNPEVFPVVEAEFKLRDGSAVRVDPEMMTKHLQYGVAEGYPDIRQWMIEFQRRYHSPPNMKSKHPGCFDLLTTNGANEGIFLTMSAFLDEDDWALSEEATYATAVEVVTSIGARVHGIKSDKEGMLTSDLDRVLTSWEQIHPGCRRPKLIYIVPSAGNPTGVTWSLARKRAVYALARSHDLMLVEDDAYGLLQFVKPVVPSFLSMDVDGRVIRLDTFSKIVAPGLKMAVLSGPAPVLEKIKLHKDLSSNTPSGVSQALVAQLLRHWGYEGFLRYADSVMEFYKRRAQMAVECATRHLSQLATWDKPSGGLFLWLRVPGIEDSDIIVEKARERGLLIMSGRFFVPSNEKSAHIRLNYAAVSEEHCDKAFRILAEVIKEVLCIEQ